MAGRWCEAAESRGNRGIRAALVIVDDDEDYEDYDGDSEDYIDGGETSAEDGQDSPSEGRPQKRQRVN